jgi:RNA polymerase sigma factor (sigma-70 family)
MDNYSHALLRYCHNILCDYHEAQDALQLTFIKAYQNRSSFRQDMSLSPWLYKIAYTTCIDILRKRKKVVNINKDQPQNDNGRIPEEIILALLKLNSLDRSIVYGRVMEEMSYDELSVIHKKSAASLRKRYERAKKRLANELADDYPYYAQKKTSTSNRKG